MSRIRSSGGDAVPVMPLERDLLRRFPYFLPGRREFLFYTIGRPEVQGVYLGLVDSGEAKRLTAADSAAAYLPPGWVMWVRAGKLLAQRLDLKRKELVGDPVVVADPVALDPATSAGAFSVSNSGLIAYRTGGITRLQLNWFDRTGKPLGSLGAPDENRLSVPHLSADGHRAAAYRTVQGNTDIWLLDGTRTSRFTFDPAADRFPVWSPDGRHIVFDSNRKGHRDLYVKPAGGAGNEELLVESLQDKVATDWSADGRFIVYHSLDPQTNQDLWILPLEGDRKPRILGSPVRHRTRWTLSYQYSHRYDRSHNPSPELASTAEGTMTSGAGRRIESISLVFEKQE